MLSVTTHVNLHVPLWRRCSETGLGDKDKDDSDKDKEGDDDASKGKAGVPLDAETQKLLDELSEGQGRRALTRSSTALQGVLTHAHCHS